MALQVGPHPQDLRL